MSIQFQCPACQSTVQTPAGSEGKQAECPQCRTVIKIPGASPGSQPEPTPQPGPLAQSSAGAMDFPCPSCHQSIRTPADSAGKQAQCPACHQVVVVPTAPPAQQDEWSFGEPSQDAEDPFAGLHASPSASSYYSPHQPQPSYQAPSQHNPYSSPSQGSVAPAAPGPPVGYQGQTAESLVKPPAICLIVLAGVWIVLCILSLIGQFVGLGQAGNDPVETASTVASMLGIIAAQGAIIFGAIEMMNLRNKPIAMTALILSLIPCLCSPWCFGGIPFGIWGLVAMSNPIVSRSFR